MDGISKVEVTGLREFNRALKRMDADLPKALRLVLNDATKIVLDYAIPQVPKRTGRTAATLKAASTRTTARVRGGGSKAAHFGWLDFGGEGRIKGRPTKREFIREGRYLWKSLDVKRDEFTEALQDGITELAHGAGLETD
jgi:hypothetical protein